MRKQHTDEKKQLDDKRSQLVNLLTLKTTCTFKFFIQQEEEINDFNKRKMQLQAHRAQAEIAKSANTTTMRTPRK